MFDPTSLLAGAAIAVLLAAIALPWLRARAFRGGRASRELELAALQQDLVHLRERLAERQQVLERVQAELAASDAQRQRLEREHAVEHHRAESFEERAAVAERDATVMRARIESLTRELAETTSRGEEQARSASEKLELLEKAEARLRDAFQNLAQQILEEKGQRFHEQNAQQLGGLLDPLKVQLKDFRETVQRTWADEQRERGALSQEIQTLRQLNQRIAEDAVNLTRALKGDTRSQGAWGEQVLERVLELSGLALGRNYELQVVFKDDEGGRPRPDVIIRLPDSKDLVIDAKVSLTAYERACSADDPATREAAIKEHVVSMRRHVDGLARRDYAALQGLRTLDFVLLFVPVEAAFIEAVRADDGLYAYALEKNISIVSPSTLLATLRTVAHLWKLEDRNVNAMEIARQAGALHDSFVLLEQELTQTRELMERALSSQEGAIKRIGSGRGNLVSRVAKLRELGASARKTMPERVLELADENADDVAGDDAGEVAARAVDTPESDPVGAS